MKRNLLYIKRYTRLLNEDYGGDYGGDFGFGGMGSGYGPQWIKGEHLKGIVAAFAAPFQELYAGAQKAIVHTEALIKIGFETIMTTLFPILSSDYDVIFKKRDQKIESVNQKYASVRKATYDAFKNHDFLVTAFCCQPAAFLTAPILLNSPKALYGVLKFSIGDTMEDALNTFTDWWKEHKRQFHHSLAHRSYIRSDESKKLSKLIIAESEEDTKFDKEIENFNKQASQKLIEIMKSSEFKDAINNSLKIKKMKKDGQEALLGYLNDIYNQASNSIKQVSSIENLNKMSNGKINNELEKAQKEFEETKANKTTSDEKEKRETTSPNKEVDEALIAGAKETVKNFFVKKLSTQLQSELKLGLPENHIYAKELQNTIEKIKKL